MQSVVEPNGFLQPLIKRRHACKDHNVNERRSDDGNDDLSDIK